MSPQNVESNIISSGICVSFPTSFGRNRLSIPLTITIQYSPKAIAVVVSHERNKIIHTGTQTIAEPITGMTDNTIITTVQNAAPGIPATQNPIPANIPCIIQIISVPLSVAFDTCTKLSNTCVVLSAFIGI